ncbi:MAG: N-acetylmuramic acid 6-phosphate etherase [Elusimicrobia bacterium]|nr:N-acetylmuramic acid 6-phosphate etherase [Elusimicrobiota bacterium]
MNKHLLYSALPTEKPNKRTSNIDRIPLRKILEKLNREDFSAPEAVRKAIPRIEKASGVVSEAFMSGKKIFFAGAGTSGRLGVLEAAELPPTFGVPRGRFTAIMAGGKNAVFLSKEGAEDVFKDGYGQIVRLAKPGDVIIGIAASGITPFARGALCAGRKIGAKTIAVTCNDNENISEADVAIQVNPGPEPITGSTRMKSGTATKMALNMLTTSAMIISGKVYKNWMVDVKPSSDKLVLRAERITSIIADISKSKAKNLLKKTGYDVKTAIVMARLKVGFKKAKALLQKKRGFLKDVIE